MRDIKAWFSNLTLLIKLIGASILIFFVVLSFLKMYETQQSANANFNAASNPVVLTDFELQKETEKASTKPKKVVKKETPNQSTTTSNPGTTAGASTTKPASGSSGSSGSSCSTTGLSYINSLRSKKLCYNSTLASWAQSWANTRASACNIIHQNLNQFLGQSIGVGTVSMVAENIGYGPNMSVINNGLKNSPTHYANMTNSSFTHAGTGTANGKGSCSGSIYHVQIFARA